LRLGRSILTVCRVNLWLRMRNRGQAMRRLVVASVFSIFAGTGLAFAADLPQPLPPPPQAPVTYVPTVPAVYNWGGIYIGINGGYGFGSSSWTPAGTAGTGKFSVNGGLVGGTLGVNLQSGPFVFGLETDLDWSNIVGSSSLAAAPVNCPCTFQTSNNWLGTVRGRAGYAIDRLFMYATAGGAYGNIKPQLTNTTGIGSSNTVQFGWTAGAGIEYALTDNFTAKVEYLFVSLANGSFSCSAVQCGTAMSVPVSFTNTSLVRVGLNYKFNL
jgi:outer membrane immunogenic protein